MDASTRPGRRHPGGWVIARAAGAPVVVSPTWAIGAVVLALLFTPTATRAVAGSSPAAAAGVSAAFVLLLFGSVLAHELAHAYTARARGHRVHTIVLTAWGGHTSFDPRGTTPGTQALVAVAGPLTNGALALAFWAGYLAATGGPISSTSEAVVALLAYAGALANGLVALFNLLPTIPLDGGAILEALVWRVTGNRRAGTRVGAWLGRLLAVGVVVWALMVSLRGTPDYVLLAWSLLVASLLWSGASRALHGARQSERIDALRADALVRPALGADQNASVADVADLAARARAPFVVLTDFSGRPVAYVPAPDGWASVPDHLRASTPAAAVAVRLAPAPAVPADSAGADLLDRVRAAAQHAPVLVVSAHGRVTGLLWVSDVAAALR
ncbi:MAG: site-2 protease family protein [Cellulomonadaceae bacterium]